MKKFGFILLGIVLFVQVLVLASPNLSTISLNFSQRTAVETNESASSMTQAKLASNSVRATAQDTTPKVKDSSSVTPKSNNNNSSNNSNSNSSSSQTTNPSTNNSSGSGNNNSQTTNPGSNGSGSTSTSTSALNSAKWYTSPLKITLSGNYLTTYNNAVKGLSKNNEDDRKRELVVHIGLQILQSEVITYENALHYYSLNYTTTCDKASKDTYSLTNAISRINSKSKIYTDCFGFARLSHCIAAYAINPSHPENVSGLNKMYGWQGGYANSSKIGDSSKLTTGSVIMDRTTGSGSGNRHVAIFLYASGDKLIYMDQKGIFTAKWKYSSVYCDAVSKPYKFAYAKDYIAG